MNSSKGKVLVVTDDAGESFEILYAKYRLLEAGYTPVIAASRKKALNAVIHDFHPDWNTYIEKPGYLIAADSTFDGLQAAEFTAMLLIGGRAPEYLRHNRELVSLVQTFAEQNKGLFAICHGIQILLAAVPVAGRRLTCYENVRSEVIQHGGEWIDRASVIDGNWITAQTWESHAEFYRDIMSWLAAASK